MQPIPPAVVPEPSSVLLLAVGMVILVVSMIVRKRRQSA